MKIFVFGSTGMLGAYVTKYFSNIGYDVVPVSRKDIDIVKVTDKMLMVSAINKGDVVINCSGLIKQRLGTTEYEFIKVNTMFPHMLAKVCEDKRAKLIHVSTDCCFSGAKGNYDENDLHDAIDIYGRSKSLGEPSNATVIRTSIIGEENSNFLSLLEWVKQNNNKKILGYTNHFWNGITCLQFAKICKFIIDNNVYWKGVQHIMSPTIVSKYELINLIIKVYNLNITVTPHVCKDFCDRSLTSIKDVLSYKIPELELQLIEQKNFF